MSSKIIFASVLLGAMLVCLASAAQEEMSASADGSMMGNTNADLSSSGIEAGAGGSMSANGQMNCPKRNGAMNYMQSMLSKMRPQGFPGSKKGPSSTSSSTSSGTQSIPSSGSQSSLATQPGGLSRQKRQADALNNLAPPELNQISPNGQQQQQSQASSTTSIATADGQMSGPQDGTELGQQDGRLRSLLRRFMMGGKGVMPSLDQTASLLTALLTLVLMSLVGGPAGGASAPLIQSLIKQVVPILVSAMLQYGAHPGAANTPMANHPVTMLPLEPVPVAQSRFRQLI